MEETSDKKRKTWTNEERLKLAAKLDSELDEYINNLEKRSDTERWPEDRWEEEMEKHPFFMKEAPKPGEKLSPLMEGLQQLKYGEDENTPEELAHNYKEDGNFNYKYKKYNLAILSYTEGIRTKCKDIELMAQLYNNRAAANCMLENYRSSLNDCKLALKLKPNYSKALIRAVSCSLQLKEYQQCIDFCDILLDGSPDNKEIVRLRLQAVTERARFCRDKRMQDKLEKKLNMEHEKLLAIIQSKGINLELCEGRNTPDITDLEPLVPELAQHRVYLDSENTLFWPVMMLYPETKHIDFIQEFHENTTFIQHLNEMFRELPAWDSKKSYFVDNVNVYFEDRDKPLLHKVNILHTLEEILKHPRLIVHDGTPAFFIFVKSSETEKEYLSRH